MDRPKSETTENLLSKIDKMEDIPADVLASSQERLNTPLKKIEYGDQGVIDIESGRWKMHAEYSTPTEKITQHFGVNEGSEDRQKTLKSLVFTVDGKEVDIYKLLPPDTEIFIVPEEESVGGRVHQGRKIFIWGDLTKPHAIIVLLHEIGHIIDIEQLNNGGLLEKIITIDEHEYSAEAAVLRRERVATAFALKIMRPLLDSEQRRDVINVLKHYALKSYYDGAKRGIEAKEAGKRRHEKDMRQVMHEYEADEEWLNTQNLYDGFEEWKKSPAYGEWKLLDKNKVLEADEEFGEWRRDFKNGA